MAVRASDQMSLVDLTDGYSVNLTLDSFTFAGDTTKVKSTQSFSTQISGYCGTSAVAAVVDTTAIKMGNGNNLISGLTVTSDNNSISPTLTVQATTAVTLAALQGGGSSIDIPIVMDNGNITIHKKIALSVALTGATGAGGYSIIIGNEAQVIPVALNGETLGASSIVIPFSVFQGTTRKACTVEYSSLPTGMSVASGANVAGTASAEGSLTITVADDSDLGGTDSGTITLTFKVGSTVIGTKVFTWSKAYTGATGATGDNAVWYAGTGITGTSTTATTFSGSGVANAKVGDMYLNTSTQNVYRCTVGGAASAAKWVYLANIKGATGTSSTNVIIGLEAVTIPCTKDGLVTAAMTITVPFAGYIGASRAACTLANPTLPSGMSRTSNTAATTSADGSLVIAVAANGTLGAAATQNGSIDLTFTCNSQTFVKKLSWSKAITGQTGEDAITMVITSSNGSIFKNTAIATTLTAHVYKAGAEVTGDALTALGTIKWYKDGASTAAGTGSTLTITAGDVTNKAIYEARLES